MCQGAHITNHGYYLGEILDTPLVIARLKDEKCQRRKGVEKVEGAPRQFEGTLGLSTVRMQLSSE